MSREKFPIDLTRLRPLKLDPASGRLRDSEREALVHNIQLARDAILFFTALAGAKGLAGHTGGPYDTVPEVMIIRAFIDHGAPILPVLFDEAGHRVATQYLLSVLNGALRPEQLLHYREHEGGLPGHPEKFLTPGVAFSSGRVGHLWAFCNGIAMANPRKSVVLLGSDGSQMEGDNAEAARLAVAQGLNIKVLIDDNNSTIAGNPHEYMPGYDLFKTLHGHGLLVQETSGECLDDLFADLCWLFSEGDPRALIVKRPMAPGIKDAEGDPKSHDALDTPIAIRYLEERGGYAAAIEMLRNAPREHDPQTFRGSSGSGRSRDNFGKVINEILDAMPMPERLDAVRVFDNDLEGSCGLHHIRKKHPEVCIRGGIMERGNYSAAAGFGSAPGKQGIYGTFTAFLEMIVSEITMARLNYSNVLAHFSHSGVDGIADNTSHFGENAMFADGGLTPDHGEDTTRLYFPADQYQFEACVKRVFTDPGLRFIFSTRAPVPDIMNLDGEPLYRDRPFEPGKDDLVRAAPPGSGFVVAVGETVYRALDAVIDLESHGHHVSLVNKSTVNVMDEEMMEILADAPYVLLVEGWNVKTGLGSRFGSYLLKAGFRGRYNHIGEHSEGAGGQWQQMGHQGLDSAGIRRAIETLSASV
jgi:transketolase